MLIEEMHYELERRWNMNSNNNRKSLTDLEKDRALNVAIGEYTYIFATGKNPKNYTVGFEVTSQMTDMVSTLVLSYPEEPLLALQGTGDNSIGFVSFSDLTRPYRFFVAAQLEDFCGKLVKVNIEQHGSMPAIANDFHRKASKLWKHVPGSIRDQKLYIYHDGVFGEPAGVRMTYIRRPAEVCIGTYTVAPTTEQPDPVALKPKQECDLPEDYHDIIVSMAMQELSRIYSDMPRYQLTADNLNSIT
jgi:hypothetical protein